MISQKYELHTWNGAQNYNLSTLATLIQVFMMVMLMHETLKHKEKKSENMIQLQFLLDYCCGLCILCIVGTFAFVIIQVRSVALLLIL